MDRHVMVWLPSTPPQTASCPTSRSLIRLSVLATPFAAALRTFAGAGAHTHVTNPQETLVQLIPLLVISKADKIAPETTTTTIHVLWDAC